MNYLKSQIDEKIQAQIEAFKTSPIRREELTNTKSDLFQNQLSDIQQSILADWKAQENERAEMLQLHQAMFVLVNGLAHLLAPQMTQPSIINNSSLSPDTSK